MEKTITIIHRSDSKNSGFVPGSMAERLALVWPLTCEVVSLSKKYDVEQPLQRHIINFIRKKVKFCWLGHTPWPFMGILALTWILIYL